MRTGNHGLPFLLFASFAGLCCGALVALVSPALSANAVFAVIVGISVCLVLVLRRLPANGRHAPPPPRRPQRKQGP